VEYLRIIILPFNTVLVLDQRQATVKSPPADCPLDVSTNVSTIIAKTTSDIPGDQVSAPNHPVDDVSRSDQNSIGSIEKKSDSFYAAENQLITGIHVYILMYKCITVICISSITN